MPLASTDIKLRKSNAHPSDDTSTAGGAETATNITNATIGEWFPRLRAKLTGILDNAPDLSKQYQKVFLKNISGADSLLDAKVYLRNGLDLPPSNGVVSFQSTNSADDNTKKIICMAENTSNVLVFDSVILNGVTLASGVIPLIRAFRCRLALVSTGALTTAAGDISIFINGNLVGIIPQGYSFATREVKLWLVSTTGDSGTSTNRKTAPAGSTFAWANTLAAAIPIRNDLGNDTLGPSDAQGIWGEVTLQPGSEAFNGVDVVLAAYGDGT